MSEVRTLRLSEMVRQQKGTLTRRIVHLVISVALRLFFYRIQVNNDSAVLSQGPIIFVLNHPNGLIDPALVFCALPRRVSFLAKSTVFEIPVVNWLLRVVEALPLYRRIDAAADQRHNLTTFAACFELLRRGRCIALFPEGISHSAPALQPLKTGAARLTLGALTASQGELTELLIVPGGLYYTARTPFRGEALLQFGEPLRIAAPQFAEADGEPPRAQVRELTEQIAQALRAVTLNFTDVAEQASIAKAETIVSAGYRSLRLQGSLLAEFRTRSQLLLGRRARQTHMPERVKQLETRLQRYAEQLGALGLAPDYLQITQHSRRELWGLVWRATFLALMFPLAWVGLLIHAPAYLASEVIAYFFRTHGPDESRVTAKVLAAILFMPLTWMVFALIAWWGRGWQLAAFSLPAVMLAGYVGLRWVEEAYDLRGWLRALFILYHRRRDFLKLQREGNALQEELSQF